MSAVTDLPSRGGRRRLVVLAAAAIACMILLVAAPGSLATSRTAAAKSLACTLVSPAQLHSILGLSQSQDVRDHDPTVAISQAVHTECVVGAWSGPKPTSPQAALQLAKSGHGAQVAIQTWEPNDGSPNVNEWLDHGYDTLTGDFLAHSFDWTWLFTSRGWPSKHFDPVQIAHHESSGLTMAPQGNAKGLVAALACWWDDQTSSAICLLDEEAAGRPVVHHLNKLAKVAVASFG